MKKNDVDSLKTSDSDVESVEIGNEDGGPRTSMKKQITIGKLELGNAKASFEKVMETNPLMMKFADKFKARLREASPNDKARFEEALKEK